jgi:hypothetical protein
MWQQQGVLPGAVCTEADGEGLLQGPRCCCVLWVGGFLCLSCWHHLRMYGGGGWSEAIGWVDCMYHVCTPADQYPVLPDQ